MTSTATIQLSLSSSSHSSCSRHKTVFRPPRLQTLRAPQPRVERSAVAVKASKYDYTTPPSIEGGLGDKYAVIEVGGLQQIVEEGHWYTCNRLQAPPGSTVNFPRVVAVRDGEKFEIGRPYLKGVTVEAEILEDTRGPKIVVVKFKRKKHYRRKIGHRQELTKFKVTTIS